MSVTTLVVAVRTTGAAGLARLGAGFTALSARASAASRTMSTSFSTAATRIRTSAASMGSSLGTFGGRVRSFIRRWQRDFQQFAGQVIQMAGSVLMSFSRWGAIGGIILAAIPALADLTGVLGLIPPAIMAAAASLVIIKAAFSGVGEAIQAGMSGKWNEWEKKHKDFPRSAHDFAAAIVLIRNSWKSLGRAIQDNFFRAIGGELMMLNHAYLPTLNKWLPKIAEQFALVGQQFIYWLRFPTQVATVDAIFRNLTEIVKNLLSVFKPLASIFLDVAYVGAPRLASITGNLADTMQRLAEKVHALRENGKLGEWVDRAREAFNQLIGIGKDVVSIIGAITQAGGADGGMPFLTALHEQTTALAAWAHSEDGQELIQFFIALGQAVIGLGYIFAALLRVFRESIQGMVFIAVNGFAEILQAADAAMGWMPGIGPQLHRAAQQFDDFRDRVNADLAGIEDQDVHFTYLVDAKITPRAAPYAGTTSDTVVTARGGSSTVTARASGGPVAAGRGYVVGERGAEFFVPSRDGRIIPNGTGAATSMGSPGATISGSRGTGLDALFLKWLDDRLFSGRIRWQVVNGRVRPV